MSAKKRYPDFSTRVLGLPCGVIVQEYYFQRPDLESWESPDDFHGYEDVSYKLLDRKGYRALWLERKLAKDKGAKEQLLQEIRDYMAA